MAIDSFSLFYFDFQVDSSNSSMDFDEGFGEIQAQVSIDNYAPTDLALALKTALDVSGDLTYTVTFNRVQRTYTIESTATFDLLIATGSQVGVSIWDLIGFTGGADLTGLSSYTGSSVAGKVYLPQFKLQDYIAPGFQKEKISPSINESANGVIEIVSFGDRQLIQFRFPWVTNTGADGRNILHDSLGIENTLTFLDYLITKGVLEFMPDLDDVDTFFKIRLEATSRNSDGTGYLLKERTSDNLRDMYDTGVLRFRLE